MNIKRAVSLLAITVAVVMAPFVSADAQPLNDRQIELIRQNCTTAQQTLQRLQRDEAATRVNRGREYETMLRLMASFNSRAALNKINAPALAATTSDLEKKFATFRTDYISYDDQLKSALKFKCTEQPVTFYDQLTLTREARTKLEQDVKSIDGILDQYQKALTDLRAALKDGGEQTP